jgi:hypothetical protein
MDPEKISHNSRVAEARNSAARSPFLWSLLLVLSVLGCSLFSDTWNTSHPPSSLGYKHSNSKQAVINASAKPVRLRDNVLGFTLGPSLIGHSSMRQLSGT